MTKNIEVQKLQSKIALQRNDIARLTQLVQKLMEQRDQLTKDLKWMTCLLQKERNPETNHAAQRALGQKELILISAVFTAFLNNTVLGIKINRLRFIAFIAILQSPLVPNTPPLYV